MDIEYTQVKSLNLYKLILKKEEKKVEAVRLPVNHIWIFDRSGSMYGTIYGLCQDMCKHMGYLPDGDTLSLGWFSTEGRYEWLVIGAALNSANRKALSDLIMKYASTVMLTCFSEILKDASERIITNLSSFPGSFNVMFFSDGYPVVSNYSREITAIKSALKQLSKKIASAMLVGYGSYYNVNLMSEMAEILGATLVHSSRLEDFDMSMTRFLGSPDSQAKRISVVLPVIPTVAVTYGDNGVQIVPVEDSVATVTENTKEIFVLAPIGHLCMFSMANSAKEVSVDSMYDGIAACAIALITRTETEKAVDLLGAVGDINLIDKTVNAWTNEEYGSAMEEIRQAIINNGKRYIAGKHTSYVPDPGAFCLVNALNLLIEDENAFFYPDHEWFHYKRTGVPTHTKEGYPDFTNDDNVACPFSKLTWNQTRLNLSILAKISGTINLTGNVVGLDEKFQAYKYRNYMLVKDGILNVTALPVSMSKETFTILQNNGMIDFFEVWEPGEIYLVELNRVPIVNRNLATAPSSVEFCGWLNEELLLEAQQKYLKNVLEKLDPTGVMSKPPSEFSPEQEEYLKGLGIKPDRTYSPPVVKSEASDYYYAKEFEVKIAGFSSLPKIDDVVTDINAGKVLTPSKAMIAEVINLYKSIVDTGNPVEVANALDLVKRALKTVREKIQATRFAILLCKRWFPDLATRDGATAEVSGKNFTFSIRDVKVEY